jgi:hypothetical protein
MTIRACRADIDTALANSTLTPWTNFSEGLQPSDITTFSSVASQPIYRICEAVFHQ